MSALRTHILPHSLLLALLLAAFTISAVTLPPLTLERAQDESGPFSRLQWSSEPGFLYRLQTATGLSDNGGNNENWNFGDALVADSTNTVLDIRGRSLPENSIEFYRLAGPAAEIFSVEPAWIDSGDSNAVLYLTGQGLPTNATVIINGVSFAATNDPSGALRVGLVGGALPGGSIISSAIRVMDNVTSNVVATWEVRSPIYYGTKWATEQLQGPPSEPPASPVAKESKGGVRVGHGLIVVPSETTLQGYVRGHVTVLKAHDDGDRGDSSALRPKRQKTGHTTLIKREMAPGPDDDCYGIFAPTGEFRCEETDLAIPGAMLDFAWTRTYRSRTGPTTAQGAGWDSSYNVSLAQNGDGTLTLRPGNGRADTFYPDGTNGWIRDEYFVEVRDLNGDSFPDVLFPDTGKWLFHPLGTPAGGKLAQIIDRNGNTITLGYDGAGRLATIVDDLGRTNTVAYNPIGLIQSVTDFTGRAVRYEYNGQGDLIAVISPPTSGFPGGITNRYTYSGGFADARLNHNLTRCVDGKGQTWLQVTYKATNNPASRDFDTVASTQRGIEKKDIWRGMVIAKPSSRFATTKVILRDALGNVTESYFDSRQRCVRLLEYPGRAPDLNAPTTETENRPVGKLRTDDPDYFETQWAWNPDSLCTLEVRGDGSRTEIVHQRVQDHNSSRSNKTASRRHEGNVLVVRERAGSAGGGDLDGDGVPDYTELVWRLEYDPRFGSPPSRVQDHNSGRSNKTASKSSVQDHNSSRSNKTASALDIDDDGDNTPIIRGSAPGTPAFIWRDDGDLSCDITRHRPSGQRVQDHNSSRSNKTASGMDMADGGEDDLNDVVLRYATRVTDPRGNVTTAEYDSTGNTTQHTRKSGSIIACDYKYNSRGQLTAITNAADANGYRRVDTFSYHASGPQAGYLESIAIDEPGVYLTSRFEYDARGNLTRYVDPLTNDWLFTYDALNQCIRIESPVNAGAREAKEFVHEAAGEVQEVVSELRDGTGVLIRSITNRFEWDLLNRCTAMIRQVSPGNFITNRFAYDANDNLVAAYSPLAVSGADPHAITAFEYDERGLLFREIGAPGSGNSPTNEWSYDARGRVRVLRGPDFLRVSAFSYDGLGRLICITDPMSNVTCLNYDRAGNLTRVRHYGETNDVPGGAGNRLLAETRYSYDALDRCVLRWEPFFDVFTGAPIGNGAATTTFAYAPNGACTSVTDDNGHTTRYAYDTAGRLASITDPKTSVLAYAYDANGNVTTKTSTETSDLTPGTPQVFTLNYAYDSRDRCVSVADNVGNTNRYEYDSLNRLTRATNPNGVTTVAEYDDLGRALKLWVDSNGDGTMTAGEMRRLQAFDDNSRVVSLADADTNVTSFAYDSLGNRTTITNADGTVCSLVWSPRSNLLRVQDPNGTTITNTYDLLDRCVRRNIVPGAGVAGTTTFETFAYDGASRLVSAVNDASTNSFAYDSLGNQKTAIRDGWQMLGAFDGRGNCLSLTYPSGRLVTYTYDALDQVKSVSTSAGGGLPPLTLATFDYDGPGRLGKITRANGVDTRLQWDGLLSPPNAAGDFGWGQVSGISHRLTGGGAILDRRACAYDRNQNKTSRAQTTPFFTGGPTATNLFAYDALDRLIGFTRGTGTPDELIRGYQLDPNGNRQVAFANGAPQVYTMDAKIPPGDFQMNQYTTTPFANQKFDDNGNLTTRGTALGATQYVYDYANRLVAVNDPATGAPVATYMYDALGRRIAKTVFPTGGLPPVTTEYVRDWRDTDSDDDGILEEYAAGSLAVSIVSSVPAGGGAASAGYAATGRAVAVFGADGQPTYLHSDDLGNTLALTDAKGNVIERYDYDDYGQPAFLTSDGFPLIGSDGQPATASAAGNSFLFHGLEWEAELGFYHQPGGAYFDPQTGRPTCGIRIDGGMPNRISMNVTVPKQTQGATFGEKVNAGLHAAGGALAQGAPPLGGNPWSLGKTGRKMLSMLDYQVTLGGSLRKKEEGGRHTPFQSPYRP